ncbi:GNAT family N-acetyltransferase [Flavobacterium sp.]|uniref:GNAT family N-acetyltransferase n=1 Tax=Flavobacterium sp. TaxID=239 RepID=UPI0022C85A5B|nr:GNAT family N-acetyltransferase [Flavobacterium sp.]MCZ8227865.1 GNAT family N-acetyltransferase [Flavobacterium sp.]
MITQATIADAAELSILVNSAYRGETSKKGWTTEADLLEGTRTTEEELKTIITSSNHYILKFTQNEKIIGSVLLIAKKEVLYLGMLTVSPELQNGGIGKQLLQAAEQLAQQLELSRIQMTVIGIRKELLAWYFRNGYEDTGLREPFPFGEGDKALTSAPLDFMVLEKKITS